MTNRTIAAATAATSASPAAQPRGTLRFSKGESRKDTARLPEQEEKGSGYYES